MLPLQQIQERLRSIAEEYQQTKQKGIDTIQTKLVDIEYPIKRRWLPLPADRSPSSSSSSSSAASSSTSPSFPFTVLSYNILAQSLIHRDMFPYSSKQSLRVNYRRENLLLELLCSSADIFALQEVDKELMETFYAVKLMQMGYGWEWGSKDAGTIKHGVVICYAQSKFTKFTTRLLQFNELATPYVEHADNLHADPQKRKCSVYEEMNRPNVALIVGLRVKEEAIAAAVEQEKQQVNKSSSAASEPLGFYVTNTHLFWDPRYRFVRLNQCRSLLDTLAQLQHQENTAYPALMLGDFNCTPDNICYEYLTDRNTLETDQEKWKMFFTPAEHGVVNFSESTAAAAGAAAAASSLTKIMKDVKLNDSDAASSAETNTTIAAPLSAADAAAAAVRIESSIDPSSPASIFRLQSVAELLRHSRSLPLLHSLYYGYTSIVPDDIKESVLASQSHSYCQWKHEPPFTNYTAKFKGTLDYIFVPVWNPAAAEERKHKEDSNDIIAKSWAASLLSPSCTLSATHILEIPPEELVSTETALPNAVCSSDHVCIAARVRIQAATPSNAAATSASSSSKSNITGSATPQKSGARNFSTLAVPAPHAVSASPTDSSIEDPNMAMARAIAASLSPPPSPLASTHNQYHHYAHHSHPSSASVNVSIGPVPSKSASSSSSSETSFPSFSPPLYKSLITKCPPNIGQPLIYNAIVTSTMDLCKQALFPSDSTSTRPTSGTVWLADAQTAGRGRVEGRKWSSPFGANLYFTFLHTLTTNEVNRNVFATSAAATAASNAKWEQLRKINQVTALSVARAIELHLQQITGFNPLPAALQPKIKWPNDIWIGDDTSSTGRKKCCGLLIDAEHCGSDMFLVIGIGINCLQNFKLHDEDRELRMTATSLQQNLEEFYEKNLLITTPSSATSPSASSSTSAAASSSSSSSSTTVPHVSRESLLAHFFSTFSSYLSLDFPSILSLYRCYDLLLSSNNGSIIVMPSKKEDTSNYYEAKAIDYSEDGYLIIEDLKGNRRQLVAEEVSVRPKK